MRIEHISTYRGDVHYRVVGGPSDGRRVSVRPAQPEVYEQDWDGGRGWNLSYAEYQRQIVASAGIVHCGTESVSADIVAAVAADLGPLMQSDPQRYVTKLDAGRFDLDRGWVRESLEDLHAAAVRALRDIENQLRELILRPALASTLMHQQRVAISAVARTAGEAVKRLDPSGSGYAGDIVLALAQCKASLDQMLDAPDTAADVARSGYAMHAVERARHLLARIDSGQVDIAAPLESEPIRRGERVRG